MPRSRRTDGSGRSTEGSGDGSALRNEGLSETHAGRAYASKVLMKLVLNGGGVGKAVESARKLLNGIIDHNKKILYIPFAWPDPTFRGCLEFMTNELSDVDKAGIDMVKTPEEDTIYVDGDKMEFIGSRAYSEFINGTERMLRGAEI